MLDKIKAAASAKRYRESHREQVNNYVQQWQLRNPEKTIASRKKQWSKNKYKILSYRKQIRLQVLEAYGNKCTCLGCKEYRQEFLSMDHIGGRKRGHTIDKLKGHQLYRWLYDNGCPQDLHIRILCHNCNQSLGCYGYCPHEKESNA